MLSSLPTGHYADDNAKSKWKSGIDRLGSFSSRGGITQKNVRAILCDPFKAYTCFLAVFFVLYELDGGSLSKSSYADWIGYVSCVLESYGLISVIQKIEKHGSVSGISGMTMIMFALTYSIREVETIINLRLIKFTLNGMALEVLQVVSLPLVFKVLWSIFKTYRNSYQKELDVLQVKYLVAGCVTLAVFVHPSFEQGMAYNLCWTSSFYIDVLALVPQVVMMSQGTGKVEAPIANFVAATAFSRIVDLWFWYFRFNLGPQGFWFGFNYSGYLIVFWHIVSIAIVADFMYYYLRARISGATFSEDTALDLC